MRGVAGGRQPAAAKPLAYQVHRLSSRHATLLTVVPNERKKNTNPDKNVAIPDILNF